MKSTAARLVAVTVAVGLCIAAGFGVLRSSAVDDDQDMDALAASGLPMVFYSGNRAAGASIADAMGFFVMTEKRVREVEG